MAGKDFVHEQRKNASKQLHAKTKSNIKPNAAPVKSIAKMNKSTGRNR